ncbi:MAG: DUF4876 domain-containing protein [Bacteroidetes bacterium HGW-Bacteroidetes-7]|jgi:hypothetical protein|nr:MAG: DUF4876 domain-containing protein [Bacteroidetes bacterium HGW-Bacteroidetes-7]
MKKSLYILYIFAFVGLLSSCQQKLQDLIDENPYSTGSRKLNINLIYPEGFEDELKAGAEVTVLNPSNGAVYNLVSDSQGKVSIELQYGFYRVSVTDKGTPISGAIPIFNRSVDQIRLIDTLKGDLNLNVELILSYAGQLIIKEIYYRGCTGPDQKTFQFDKYLAIYNNSDDVAYLDSVCFGTVEPYNAPTSPTAWSYIKEGQRVIRDTIPIIEAVWQFPGTGKSHPLQPGEQAVVAISAAVNHTILRPQSVNLDVPGYWVCYNQRYTNASYHPSPGPNLVGRWLDLLWKGGTANAYPFSVSSPATVIFRIPEVGAQAYVNDPANRSRKPGTTSATEYIMIPSAWVLDGVESFDVTTKNKRLPASIDASYSLMESSDGYQGKTIHRKIDPIATAIAGGRIVYMDTNNSLNDFYVRESQSIKE